MRTPLSLNEIKDRALTFSKNWENVESERAEAQTFWNEFFEVFGISRRRFAQFEVVSSTDKRKNGRIDLLWKGNILVEHKSAGSNLERAYQQAINYFPGIKDADLPKLIVVCDFKNFNVYDLDENKNYKFKLNELAKNIGVFAFIAGYQKHVYKDEDPVNIKAAELMGKLHDQLKESGYEGHQLEVYLVRLLFCLFADDTNIFEKDTFKEFIELKTKEDGSDLGAILGQFFEVLNKPREKRQKNLDEHLNNFPYINGKLFEEHLDTAAFNSKMRNILLECSALDWGKISPAIFGSMFQSVMNPAERRDLGAHYTSEKNILKLIKPLFLDELYKEFNKVKNNPNKLTEFHKKLAELKFLDPACGCGNFLVITYRELRLLELEILRIQQKNQQSFTIDSIAWLDVDQFYGIEYEEWPARIAEVALWLMDHQMNMVLSEEFGNYYARLPLKKSATIINGNALKIDWNNLIYGSYYDLSANNVNINLVAEQMPHYDNVNIKAKSVKFVDEKDLQKEQQKHQVKFDYILGNPPFYGKQLQTKEQKEDMKIIFDGVKGAGVLDYVTAWYIKAAKYIQGTKTRVAFVSTNSITQGEQVSILWNELFNNYNIKIHFAHRTFKWNNEAKANAAVHVVIIGFANFDINEKYIFEYEDIKGEPHLVKVKNINPYLINFDDVVLLSRTNPICNVPPMKYGSKPVDDGNLIIEDCELDEFIKNDYRVKKFIRPLISSKEYLNGKKRWCLWLKDISPAELRSIPSILKRVESVKKFRLKSKKEPTREAANFPTLFAELRQPENDFIFFPLTTSENRKYIPLDFFTKENIVNNSCAIIQDANYYHFGILSSNIHTIWIKYTCGRLKSDFRYSSKIVYNNFPWPKDPSEKNKKTVEKKAQKVLDIRKEFPNSSLADLYDPLTMPPKLVKAHKELDKAVDLCYRPQPFPTEISRIEYLFYLYQQYTEGFFKPKKFRKKR